MVKYVKPEKRTRTSSYDMICSRWLLDPLRPLKSCIYTPVGTAVDDGQSYGPFYLAPRFSNISEVFTGPVFAYADKDRAEQKSTGPDRTGQNLEYIYSDMTGPSPAPAADPGPV